MDAIYYSRREQKSPFKIYSNSPFRGDNGRIYCKIKGIPVDGRLQCQAIIQQKGGSYGGYKKLSFEYGEKIVIISASVSNPYLLLVFRETA